MLYGKLGRDLIARSHGNQTRPIVAVRNLFLCSLLINFCAISSPSWGEEISQGFYLNAYLTQAWGITDGVPFLGLDEDGRFDYRSAALLFRYEISKKDSLVFQLAHEDLGNSAFDEFRDDIELDWAFYQRKLGENTQVRVGRLPIPFGIYNELRDVGTTLELFRPPVGIYYEGSFSSETLDGVSFSHSFLATSAWNLDLDLYLGSWERNESAGGRAIPGEARDGIGAQLWLGTPVNGLRFGVAAQSFDQQGGEGILRIGETDYDYYLFSADADFDRFWVRAELLRVETSFLTSGDITQNSYYILAGYRATERLSLHVLWEDSLSKSIGSALGPPVRLDPFYQDLAISLGYRISDHALLRLEAHQAKSFQADIPRPDGQLFFDVDYGIVSIAVAF